MSSRWAIAVFVLSASILSIVAIALRSPHVKAARLSPEVRIMPIGDSITYGVDDRFRESPSGGYRNILKKILTNHGEPVLMVGSVKDSNVDATPDNEGHRAWTIRQMNEQAAVWCRTSKPDIILVHAGTNDLVRECGPNMAADRLQCLIQTLLASSQAKIYVASVVPVRSNNSVNADIKKFRIYNQRVPGVVAGFESSGRVFYVDMNSATWVPADYGSTGVHLSPSGYVKMAHIWAVSLSCL